MASLKISSKNIFIAIFIFFLMLVGGATLFGRLFGISLGVGNYWDYHGWFLLLFMITVPRLTLLFSSIASGGFFWWMGWLFAPRFLIALMATINYWHSNEILLLFSGLIAIARESTEKCVIKNRTTQYIYPKNSKPVQEDIFEAEFREK